MRKLLGCAVLFASLQLSTACTYTNAVSLTNTPSDRTNLVEASAKKNIFLGFNFDNDHVLTLTEKLKEQCPGGEVRGILTKDLTTLYFLGFFWARETIASGYCVKGKAVAETGAGIEDGIVVSHSEQAAEVEL